MCIASLEFCSVTTSREDFQDIKALGLVMKQLMETGIEDGNSKLQRPELWTPDAMDFLSSSVTATPKDLSDVSLIHNPSLSKLIFQHNFLKHASQPADLVLLISLAARSAPWFYDFTNDDKELL